MVTDEFSGNGAGGSGLLLTRLTPPAQPARLLRRSRVEALLAETMEYPLTTVAAPAGSGKTVALAALAIYGGWPAAWCRISAEDDPRLLLRHLAAAFRPVVTINEARIGSLADSGNLPAALDTLVNELAAALDDETLLVLDDYHLADDRPGLRAIIERLTAVQPLRLHLALSTRAAPTLPGIDTARLRGELLELGPADLAFTSAELRNLCARASQPPPADADEIVAAACGWPLAMQTALGAGDWRAALGLRASDTHAAPLDAYLADEVLGDLPGELRGFVLRASALRRLEPEAAALLTDGATAAELIATIRRRRLFLSDTPEGPPTFQPIFHAFLVRRARAEVANWHDLHLRLSEHYRAHADDEAVLHHLAAAGDSRAVGALATAAEAMFATGQPERALAWVRHLRPLMGEPPALIEVQAAALRHLDVFDAALAAYGAAEAAFAAVGDVDGQVRALRGQAEVYLDTVQPAPATNLLKRALKLLPRERAASRASILRLQAENWANRGRADVALILERAAREQEAGGRRQEAGGRRQEASSVEQLPARLLLRAGRLDEARRQLEDQLRSDAAGDPVRQTGAHREPLLLLSLIYAMLGGGARALAMARRSLEDAQQAGARLTEAIAELRLGHAYQLVATSDTAPAQARYTAGMQLIGEVGVARTRAEGLMGQTLLHGHAGDLVRAEIEAKDGLQIAAAAGDEWTAACLMLALGGAAAAMGDERAAHWLDQAHARFARGGDVYGQAIVHLWRALSALRTADTARADPEIVALLDLVAAQGYVGVLIAPSLFGPRDMATIVPLLLRGRGISRHVELARQLLRQGFPNIAADDAVEDYHPGYTLRVQMLGTFRVWRGAHEIQAREWQREKARQLFQLLLTYRGHWIQREQICAWLWPEADLDAAERQFKVTLNALNAALEPHRPPRVQPFFIRRQGLAYSFAPSYGVWIDVDEFELRVAGTAARDDPDFARRNAQIAVQLYRGDYLAESLYDLWTIEERERLIARYLATAVGHAQRLSDDGEQAQAIQLCERVLRHDSVYEEAYQTLMRAHARAGSRSQAMRSYTRCAQTLRSDMGIEPLPETVALYERVKRNEPI
ncbi:BTAD domain-containing putative transcriptional regulator [Oscillochloris sp. ZM17-4]|uniref:BTAD domain-containing putative transcriptional regulator n=1 Tax=Oscillochloris sp. ZM17-4 TaxID=2866714 RepID=UPI00351D8DFE